jgi:hypothetical protein
VGQCVIVEKWHEDFFVCGETASDEWIIKDIDGHSIIVDAE